MESQETFSFWRQSGAHRLLSSRSLHSSLSTSMEREWRSDSATYASPTIHAKEEQLAKRSLQREKTLFSTGGKVSLQREVVYLSCREQKENSPINGSLMVKFQILWQPRIRDKNTQDIKNTPNSQMARMCLAVFRPCGTVSRTRAGALAFPQGSLSVSVLGQLLGSDTTIGCLWDLPLS